MAFNIEEIKLPLSDETLKHLTEFSKTWALGNGLLVASTSMDESTYHPFTLLPSPIPRVMYQRALSLQSGFNELLWKVTNDAEFMTSALKSVIPVDDFTRRLFQIYKQVLEGGFNKPVTLAIVRCDYLLESTKLNNNLEWKQVEINTIACSNAGLSTLTTELHKQVLSEYGISESCCNIPANPCLDGICEGLARAAQLYGRSGSVILFVVTETETNLFDIMDHVNKIKDVYKTRVIIRSLLYLGKNAILTNRILAVDGMEVAVVYYRCGYDPAHYTSEKEWWFKLIAEQSTAAVCPSIAWHLVGTKKIQQELSKPGILERFINDPEMVQMLRATFTGQYTLELNKEGDAAAAMGIANPGNYVMKPQRESGRYRDKFFGDGVRIKLQELSGDPKRASYILMERIRPQAVTNYEMRRGLKPVMNDSFVELGIYGILLCKDNQVIYNKPSGHLLRTKYLAKHDNLKTLRQDGCSSTDSPYLT